MKKVEFLKEYIENMCADFAVYYERYRIDKLALESRDKKYKDTENNIFEDPVWGEELKQYIEKDSALYREGKVRYEDIDNTLEEISEKIKGAIIGLKARKMQGNAFAKKIYGSTIYYLQDSKIRLKYHQDLISHLMSLQEQERIWQKNGVDICVDEYYEIYLLNKCILLNQLGYCKRECLNLLHELNDRINDNPYFSGEFYYKLAELNFSLQKYERAQLFLTMAIERLEQENEVLKDGSNPDKRGRVLDKLFSSYQLQVLGYEFCEDYKKAISLLTQAGSTSTNVIEELIAQFNDALKDSNGIEGLAFPTGIKDDYQRRKIEERIEQVLVSTTFQSKIYQFIFSENGNAFQQMVRKERDVLSESLKKIGIKDSDGESKEEKINRIIADCGPSDADGDLIAEYAHILAHCVNEYGVAILKKKAGLSEGEQQESSCQEQQESSCQEQKAKQLILLGRALMLFASRKNPAYKSCYATTFAEAGDLAIAKKGLQSIIENDQDKSAHDENYQDKDVTTKAEISFFYYLIDGILRIENGEFEESDQMRTAYNRYLNYCYRSFDYDAIAHIKIYQFRNKVARLLRHGDLEKIADEVLRFSQERLEGRVTHYEKLVNEIYSHNSNERLRREYEKIKYMYSFLLRFCQESKCDDEEGGQTSRSIILLNDAIKYMHYYNSLLYSKDKTEISYTDGLDKNNSITWLKRNIPGIKIESNYVISSPYCVLCFSNDNISMDDFLNEINSSMEFAISKMFMIVSENIEDFTQYKVQKEGAKFRFFDTYDAALREFIILNTFFIIKDDFTDPQNIFVLSPIGTAKSCQYSIHSEVELMNPSCMITKTQGSYIQNDLLDQFRSISHRHKRIKPWKEGLNEQRFNHVIRCIIELVVNKASNIAPVKYQYAYCAAEKSWQDAVLFCRTDCFDFLNRLYEGKMHGRKPHEDVCKSGASGCSVIEVRQGSEEYDQFSNHIKASFIDINVQWDQLDCVLIWRGRTQDGRIESWRIIGLNSAIENTIFSDIRQKVCGSGEGLVFASSAKNKVFQWPEPFDYEKNNSPFFFLSHRGRDDELVKSELNTFFAEYQIPIWYDRDRIIDESAWTDRVRRVIEHPCCVGAIIMITNEDFFKSDAICTEMQMLSDEVDRNHAFSVLPIIYGNKIASSRRELSTLIIRTVTRDTEEVMIRDLIVPPDKVCTFLNDNQTLLEYTKSEQTSRGASSLIEVCRKKGINIKGE